MDTQSPICKQFYAQVQDKLHYAIHGHTAAELIKSRADAGQHQRPIHALGTRKTISRNKASLFQQQIVSKLGDQRHYDHQESPADELTAPTNRELGTQ
ncbi:MAG TPA: RhuM family protein [Burkholderiales bacterium]|nr:RhuM family protein [Burkholderiales bacterium]